MRDTISHVEVLVEAIAELAALPSPRGAERPLADRMVAWAGRRWPDLGWTREGANLVARSGTEGPELLLYSHLDTSLSGDPTLDRPATGLLTPVAPLSVIKASIAGFGLGVAKAPAAAAIIGYARAATTLRDTGRPHRLTLLLAGGGTHRSPFGGPVERAGIDEHLSHYPRPAAAVVAKAGPDGILLAEPGAMFVRVRFTAAFVPVLARNTATPDGGLLAHLGTAVRAVEQWRADHLAARADPAGAIAAEVGIGAVAGGLPGKPDLLPGSLDLHLYVVTLPGDSIEAVADGLRGRLEGLIPGTAVEVDAHLDQPAGATSPDAPIARHAAAAWTARRGAPPPPITGWKGSTDGAALRAHGVDTVRLGPVPRRDPGDPRRDVFAVADLVTCADLYADIALRYAAGISL
jgi:acetylornithine deacetylase/succinyl-diaminopimelate desuccinylase-like protein